MGFSRELRKLGGAREGRAAPSSPLAARQTDAQRLMATGLVGRATVAALRDTGATVAGNPQVEFELVVTVDGEAAYPVTHRQVVSRQVIANFQPGASIPVRVDPADRTRVLIG